MLLFNLRLPTSKGDLFAQLFEIIIFSLSFVVGIINSYSWMYRQFKLEKINLHNPEQRDIYYYTKLVIERVHQWGSFRVYTIAMLTLVLHFTDIALNLL